MKYLKKINNQITYPYTISDLKKDNPNTSFPENLSVGILNNFNVHEVKLVTVPSDYTKNFIEDTPVFIDGVYYQNWIEQEATAEEIAKRLDGQWNVIRSIRNSYLQESDWTQLPDSPLTTEQKAEWITYRQELRDVTQQPDPFNIIWPIKP